MADFFSSEAGKSRNVWTGLVPYDPAKHRPRDNLDGSYSTEIEVTGESYDGKTWNIPTLWFDADGNPRELPEVAAQTLAKRYEDATGKRFPRFGSIDEAVAAAKSRSASGGAMASPLAESEHGGFFSSEAGQSRRNWLNNIDNRIAEGLRYYLGPSGIDQSVNALARGGQMLMDGADYQDAYTTGGELMQSRSIPEAASNFLAFAAPAAAVMIPGISNRMIQGGASAVEDAARFAADESGAMRLMGGGSPAQDVADLLAQGRAGDVTDEMMAKVDPQEMWRLYQSGATGADMPMDAASRMQRAEGMGFDTGTPLYHGTGVDVPSLQPSRRGAQGAGVYTTDSPDAASFYARDFGRDETVYPLNTRGEYSKNTMKDTSIKLGPDGTDMDYGFRNDRVVSDPANIRSRFARFDPRLKHLANLSAAGAGAAVVTNEDDGWPRAREQFRAWGMLD